MALTIFNYFFTVCALKFDILELTYAMKYLAGKVGMGFDYLMRSLNKTFDWNKALSDAIGTQETMQSVRHYPLFSITSRVVIDWLISSQCGVALFIGLTFYDNRHFSFSTNKPVSRDRLMPLHPLFLCFH